MLIALRRLSTPSANSPESGPDSQRGVADLFRQRLRFVEAPARIARTTLPMVDVAERDERRTAKVRSFERQRPFGHIEQLFPGLLQRPDPAERSRQREPEFERPFWIVVAEQGQCAFAVASSLAQAFAALRLLGCERERRRGIENGWLDWAAGDLSGQMTCLLEVIGQDLDELRLGPGKS
jgi:hypothetical protein